MSATVVVLDYGSGNVRRAVRALEHVGADVELTADPAAALAADGLFVPGRRQLPRLHGRAAPPPTGPQSSTSGWPGGRPVLGVCVGMQVMFERVGRAQRRRPSEGLGEWPGTVARLQAPVVPHMGWSDGDVAGRHACSSPGIEDERFYFVHSYAVQPGSSSRPRAPFAAVAPHGDLGRPRRAGSSPRSRTARCRRPSSTPRSPATPGSPCCDNWVVAAESVSAAPGRDPLRSGMPRSGR